MAVLFDKTRIRLTQRSISAGKAEVLCVTGRRIVIFAVYIPSRARAPQVKSIMQLLSNEISKIKTEMNDPIVIVAGDYNKKPFDESIVDFPNIAVLETGHTRGSETLDYIMTNIQDCTATVKPPLESFTGRLKSDHNSIYVKATVGNEHRFEWKTIQMRPKTKEGDRLFGVWIMQEPWHDVLKTGTPDEKATLLANKLDSAMKRSYPVKTKKMKSSDDPWITPAIKSKIRARKKTFAKQFRSTKWKEEKKETTRMTIEEGLL